MKNKTGNYYQRGSVSALAIMAILFFVVVIAAIMPMTNTEMKFAATNRNDTEARYAAEAGAKRAITEMLAEQTNWGWLEGTKGATDKKQAFISDRPVDDYYYSVYIEKYPVESPSAPLTGKPVIGQQYKIISTGYVNGSKKVVSVIYKMKPGTSGSITDNTVYVKNLVINKTASTSTIEGDIVTESSKIDGLNVTGTPTWNATGLKYPEYDFSSFKKDAFPLNPSSPEEQVILTSSIQLDQNKYYVEKGLSIPQATNGVKMTVKQDTVIMVNGDVNIDANNFTIDTGTDPVTKLPIYAVLLVVFGDINIGDKNNTDFSNTVLVSLTNAGTLSGGNIRFKNNLAVTGLVIAETALSFDNNAVIAQSKRDLAATFNEIMVGYETGTSGGGTTAGEAEITNWKIE